MVAPYQLTKLQNGTIEIRNADGGIVRDETSNEEFLAFLHWNSMQNPVKYPDVCGVSHLYFYNDVKSVVQHFKKFAALIHTVHNSFDPDWCISRDLSSIQITTNIKHHFRILDEVAPFPQHPDLELAEYGRSTEKSGFGHKRSRVAVTDKTLHILNEELKNDESEVRRVSSWTVSRCFVYLDVSDFSKMPPGHQILVINSIVNMVENQDYWFVRHAFEAKENLEAQICIGDGYIFVLKDPLKAAFFAAYLANLIEILAAKGILPITFHFRMGAHMGEVYSFHDPGRKGWNYIGDGINGGQRVLGAVGKDTDDVLFISAQLRQAIVAKQPSPPDFYPDILGDAHNRGRKADKHGNPWRVYEINHSSLMAQYNRTILGSGSI